MTPSKAAKIIGCDISHVRRLIKSGSLKAQKKKAPVNKHGYYWEITEAEVRRYANTPQTKGWPRGKERTK